MLLLPAFATLVDMGNLHAFGVGLLALTYTSASAWSQSLPDPQSVSDTNGIAARKDDSREAQEALASRYDQEAERFRKAGNLGQAIEKARAALATALDPERLFGLGVLYEKKCSLPESHEVMNLLVQTDWCLKPADDSLTGVCEEARDRLAREEFTEAYCDGFANGSALDVPRSGSFRGEHGRAGNGEFDLGGKGKGSTQYVPGNTHVIGGLTADEVGRIIRRHWNELKYCYEQELQADTSLAGRVSVFFQIGPMGNVVQAAILSSELHNENVESCMIQNVRRWRFPNPRGGGVVEIHYPFIFSWGDDEYERRTPGRTGPPIR